MNHIKFQNVVNFSIKRKRKYKTSPHVNEKDIKYLPSRQETVKVYSKNTGRRKKVCPKLIIKTPEWRNWYSSNVFIVNFELSHTYVSVSFVDFEQVITSWVNKINFYNTPLLNTCSRCFWSRRYMVLFPIGATWKMQRLSEGRRLLEGGAYLDEAWHLLEELRYSSIKNV